MKGLAALAAVVTVAAVCVVVIVIEVLMRLAPALVVIGVVVLAIKLVRRSRTTASARSSQDSRAMSCPVEAAVPRVAPARPTRLVLGAVDSESDWVRDDGYLKLQAPAVVDDGPSVGRPNTVRVPNRPRVRGGSRPGGRRP